jgi:hypothetical protein
MAPLSPVINLLLISDKTECELMCNTIKFSISTNIQLKALCGGDINSILILNAIFDANYEYCVNLRSEIEEILELNLEKYSHLTDIFNIILSYCMKKMQNELNAE